MKLIIEFYIWHYVIFLRFNECNFDPTFVDIFLLSISSQGNYHAIQPLRVVTFNYWALEA